MEGYVKKQFSKGFRNRAIIALIICVIFGLFLFKTVQAGLFNYKVISKHSDIEIDLNSDNEKYVKIDSTTIYYTGCYYTLDNVKKASYYIVDLEDRYILALLPLDTEEYIEDYSFTGKLRKADSIDKEVISELIKYYVAEAGWNPEYAEYDLPNDYVIESLSYKSGYLVTGYIQIAGTLISLGFAIYYLYFTMNPQKHKKYNRLEKYGDIDSVIEGVERDLDSDIRCFDTKNFKIMRNYVIQSTMFGIDIYKTNNIMWIYKVITQHRTNGIPSGKTYALEIKFSDPKERIQLPMKNENQCDETIDSIKQSLPKVLYGFSDELSQMYVKDFEGFKQMWRDFQKEQE